MIFRLSVLVALVVNGSAAFQPQRSLSCSTQLRQQSISLSKATFVTKPLFMVESKKGKKGGEKEGAEDDEVKSMSFDEAAIELFDEQEKKRAERTGNSVSEEEAGEFANKQGEYDTMRDRIRARASELNMEKSKATSQAIEAATARALNQEEPQALDMSKFTLDDDEDELTPDEKKIIDRISQMNWIDQAKEEFAATKWPSAGATLRQAGLMLVIFTITALYILKLDEVVRTVYTDNGLIPPPDAVFDFSDLELPEKWTEMMDASDLKKM